MGALDYQEMPGYPKESHDLGEFTATRKLLCDWGDRYAVYLGFVPTTGLGAQYIYAGTAVAYAIGGTIEPVEAELLGGSVDPPRTNIDAAYTDAIVTVTFKTPGAGAGVPMDNRLVPGELISEVVTPTNEFLTLDYTLFRWSSGEALKEREAPSRQLHGFTWVVTRHKVALPILADGVRTWANSVNTDVVTAPSINFTFPAKTLLYTNPIITRLDGSFGRVKMPFSYRLPGWDKFWNVKTGEYETIEAIDGAGTYINYPDQPFAAAGVLGVFA